MTAPSPRPKRRADLPNINGRWDNTMRYYIEEPRSPDDCQALNSVLPLLRG
jgi:hypothetical protein